MYVKNPKSNYFETEWFSFSPHNFQRKINDFLIFIFLKFIKVKKERS